MCVFQNVWKLSLKEIEQIEYKLHEMKNSPANWKDYEKK